MKYFIISDIHGSEYYTRLALERFKEEAADYIIILGDILYHGARNDLPKGHNPKAVIELLNMYSSKILAVRGNCDSEVDTMVLNFPIDAGYGNIILGKRRVFLTHGHIYNEENLVDLDEGSIFLYGHTHILRAEKKDGLYYLNPGSLALAKSNNPNTYGVLDEDGFTVKDLGGGLVKSLKFS